MNIIINGARMLFISRTYQLTCDFPSSTNAVLGYTERY